MRDENIDTGNKGFTLVELLVSFAILTIVTMAIVGLMATSMKYYSNNSSIIGLQYEYQIIMTQLKEYVVDCNGGIAFDPDEGVLYVVNIEDEEMGGGDVDYLTHVFIFDAPEETFYYAMSATGTNRPVAINPATIGSNVLSARMTDFDVIFGTISVAGEERLASVTAQMGFTSRARTYESSQDIAIRNRIPAVTGAGSYDALCDLLDPSIT